MAVEDDKRINELTELAEVPADDDNFVIDDTSAGETKFVTFTNAIRTGAMTLTNKTIDLTSNTLTGTTAQFNTAMSDGSFATLAGTETLTNKTLTSPVISTISNTGTLTLPTSTDTLVGKATTDTLTNKTLTAPIISTISNTGTLTLPTSTDTLVGKATTDTLTNKTIDAASNTLSNIGTSSISDDAITPAKWTNPYCFRAYASSGTSIADAGSGTKVNFQTEDYDYNNNFASSTYTAPVAGVYHFNARVELTTTISGGIAFYVFLKVNSTEITRGSQRGASFATSDGVVLSDDILLAANDTVTIYAYQDSHGAESTYTGTEHTFFSGHLVHAT